MSATRSDRTRRRRRRRPLLRLLGWVILLAVVFGGGVALGMALHDNPTPNLTVTTTKTVVP